MFVMLVQMNAPGFALGQLLLSLFCLFKLELFTEKLISLFLVNFYILWVFAVTGPP